MVRVGLPRILAILPVAVLVILSLCQTSHAQPGFTPQFELAKAVQLDRIESVARSHLERVDALVDDHQWDEAVETLRQVMENHGSEVTEIGPGHYVRVREKCHARIAALPPEALRLYRDRLDPLAEQWLAEGLTNRDAALLQDVVEQFFCTSFGDDALMALGELELERGRYEQARHHWERISPLLRTDGGSSLWQAIDIARLDSDWVTLEKLLTSRDQPPEWLAYPGTDLPIADVRARLALVSIREGNLPRAKLEWEILRRLHPEAEGQLAGRTVNYAKRLEQLLDEAGSWPSSRPNSDWPTFAGAPQRTKHSPPMFRISGPAWPKPLRFGEPLSADSDVNRAYGIGGRRIAEDSSELLSHHPIVLGDLVLIANIRSEIYAFNLHTGQPAWGSDEEHPGRIYKPSRPEASSSSLSGRGRLGVPRFTLSAADGKLFARLGDPVTARPRDHRERVRGSYLVCLDLDAQGKLLWEVAPESDDWAFEGSPISDGAHLYVALRRSDVRPQAHVACYDIASGRLLWRKFICAAETPARGQIEEVTHNLLTLQAGTIYYNTNLGGVAALRASDGAIRWIRLYPRVTQGDLSQRASHLHRDLTPCVYSRGILLVAPSDSRQILGISALTGRLLWANDLPADVIHFLGVVDDTLLASGDRLWWIDILTGKVRRRWPDGDPSFLRGYGRGTIAHDQILWPTRKNIHVLPVSGSSHEQVREPILLASHQAKAGNLVLAQGYLLIASPRKLYALGQLHRRERVPEIKLSRVPLTHQPPKNEK